MTEKIYGIDVNEEITPIMVRDAISECFWQAHCIDSEIPPSDQKANKEYCLSIVRKAFKDTGGNFESPTKESILKCLENLAEFSKNFRDQSIVMEHYKNIIQLVNKL